MENLTFKTFNELWEACEKFHQENMEKPDNQGLLDELVLKTDLYKAVTSSTEASKSEEIIKAKSRLFGEILMTLTNLSLKEDINVFEALATAYKHHAIDFYSKKYE